MKEPPPKGSLRESVLLLLIIQKDQVEHAATRLLTQAQVNAEGAKSAFDDYIKIRYPYLETAKKREKDETIKTLLSEVKKGPLVIRPMGDTTKKVKGVRKVERSELVPQEPGQVVTSRLMKKIGRSLPL